MAAMMVFAFIALAGLYASGAYAQEVKPAIGFKAPNATVLDLEGNEVDLYSIIDNNKVTLVLHWTTWCRYCKKVMPELEKVYKKYADKGVAIAAVSYKEAPVNVKVYATQNK